MTISVLDKNTIKLLTTTQIITSVSIAVKELIENALDANAKNIEINLTDHGSSLIEVKDDGCGISKEDTPCMGLPSHTSKISSFSDLDFLVTYGFRGEALSALCAVADVTITTKTDKDEVATSYTMDQNGHISKSELCHRSTGTTVQLRNLFYRIPVRRQIITDSRKVNQDLKLLDMIIKRYAICKYYVRFTYRVNNSIVFSKPCFDTIKDATTYVLGKKVVCNMSWFNLENSETSVHMMVPQKIETNSDVNIFQVGGQYIFINDRPIKNMDLEKTVTKYILEGLQLDYSLKKKPIFLLHILVDPSNLDVNLEPNKTTVLLNEQHVILALIGDELRRFYGIPPDGTQMENRSIQERDYQDYTNTMEEKVGKSESPVSKKRKLCNNNGNEGCIGSIEILPQTLNDSTTVKSSIDCKSKSTNDEQQAIAVEMENRSNSNPDCNNHQQDAAVNATAPHTLFLSDTDSNDGDDFILIPAAGSVKAEEDCHTVTCPRVELDRRTPALCTQASNSLSQLPVVDLGDDFDVADILSKSVMSANEKENQIPLPNAAVAKGNERKKESIKKDVTLDAWSKGHVPGLQGGTNVKPDMATKNNESFDNISFSPSDQFLDMSTSKGFVLFCRQVRPQITKNNSSFTVPQVAQKLTTMWKELPAEERGYYRDLAREKNMEYQAKKKEKEKSMNGTLEKEKNKKRLLSMLEKMNTLKVEKKENVFVRTIVSWDIDSSKVTAAFKKTASPGKTLIVGPISTDLWIVKISSRICLLNYLHLKRQLSLPVTDEDKRTLENVEVLLKEWISKNDDFSLLHPVYDLNQSMRI